MVAKKKTGKRVSQGIYEFWCVDGLGYRVMSQAEGRRVKAGTLLAQGRITVENGTVWINDILFAQKKGRSYTVVVNLRPGIAKNMLGVSLRAVLSEEELI